MGKIKPDPKVLAEAQLIEDFNRLIVTNPVANQVYFKAHLEGLTSEEKAQKVALALDKIIRENGMELK